MPVIQSPDELDVPDEHENSYYRDMDLQNSISQLSSAKFIFVEPEEVQ